MSHPIKNMPAGYKVHEVRWYNPASFDTVIVKNYQYAKMVVNYCAFSLSLRDSQMLESEDTTAIFRIKWKP